MAGGESYYIEVNEVDKMLVDYLDYEKALAEALKDIGSSIRSIVGLDTFQGVSAQSVKAYFQEVHFVLIDCLNTAVEQLETDFSKEYMPGFSREPVSAGDGACLPERELEQVEKSLRSLIDGDLADAKKCVQTAQRCLPHGISFSMPNSGVVKTCVDYEENRIKKIRLGARDLEDKGYAALSSENGVFEDAAASLAAAIAVCASGSVPITSFSTGGFKSVIESTGLRASYERCVSDQSINREKVIRANKDCLDRESVRIREAEQKAAEEKAFWCGFGLIASTIALAAAVVATAGAASPLLILAAGLTTYKSATDTFSRAAQYGSVLSGKAEAKQDDFQWKTVSEAAGIAGGAAKRSDGFGKAMHAVKAYEVGSHDKMTNPLIGGFGLVKDFGKDAVDATFDYLEDATDGEGLKALVGATGEIASEAYDQFVNDRLKFGEFDGWGLAGAAGGAGVVVADYYIDQVDEQLEKLNDRSKLVDDLKSDVEADSSPTWSAAW